ncbi:uncharacterized protein B0P05DRAFT_583286 [Gilbertella persicaria]|uniref:uncharacterized protein n=1 Tax=Gilbertella persicaria TaxID=101096 RepID=UPI00221ECE58|nr:uncharacterized protein B0P05DRAFT_583286 [Gilbertella persicaria]KAI8095027.1 hypothetical protein B0P05DRAFT_583286 [Gilbertella persicaria]
MSSKQSNASASKKIRMTMACERCRSKKVKCDFAHPQCARCQQAKVECSYDGSATQIDLFNLVKLNETVDLLQKRVQSIESDIKDVCSNTQYVANEIRVNRESSTEKKEKEVETVLQPALRTSTNNMSRLMAAPSAQWSLSLTPKGLRIDTNIASLHDLYDILLSGVSQLDFASSSSSSNMPDTNSLETSSQSSSSTNGTENTRLDNATLRKKNSLWKTRIKAFPLYSSWDPENVCTKQQDSDIKAIEKMPKEVFTRMISIFGECFLCLPCYDPNNSIALRFENGTLDPLLANSVFAWTARHAAIYHDLFPGKDPNQVGHAFFLKAKSLVKERFMKTSVDTMNSLLIMYIYAIGIPSKHKTEVESEAYIYLGLAIRMCLDLKMNMESKSDNPFERESHRRFFWSLFFLETLGSIHSDRPFSLPPRNQITVGFPTVMKHEESGEKRYRVEFMIQRYKITRIYRNIIYKTTEEKPLLSQISAIDKELEEWHKTLPSYFQYKQGDIHRRNWASTSFREQACIKLNCEYYFQLSQLYSQFFSKCTQEENSTIEVLSRDICLKAASNTVELLECWVQLKQLWCHFSLENLMMATSIYGSILSEPNRNQREIAQKNLEKTAKILATSPVRHQKYVVTLVARIKAILKEALDIDLVIEKTPLAGTVSKLCVHSDVPIMSTSEFPIAHISLGANPLNPKKFEPTTIPSTTSDFEMHKPDHFSQDMHFSDFVYTPTILDYGMGNNNLMIPREYVQQEHSFSSPYNPQGYSPHAMTSSPQPNTNMPFHPPPPQLPLPPSWVQVNSTPQPVMLERSQEGYYSPHHLSQSSQPSDRIKNYYNQNSYDGPYYR